MNNENNNIAIEMDLCEAAKDIRELRASLKSAHAVATAFATKIQELEAENKKLRETLDYYIEIAPDSGYDPHTEADAARAEEEKKRQEERMAKVEWWRGSTDPDVIAKVFPCTRPFTDEEKAEIVRLRANSTPNTEGKNNPPF